jgi:hypothetical protein
MSARSNVRRIRVDGREMVAKSATGAGRAHLRREAEICSCLAGADVVVMVALRESDDRTDLVTEFAGDHDLAGGVPSDPTTLHRALITATTALAGLHDRGWSHGAICAEHVVVDRAGTSTLCSLGSARPLDEIAAAEDVEQLRRVVHQVLERPAPQWEAHDRSHWRRWARSVRRPISDAEDLRELGAALAAGATSERTSWHLGVPPRRAIAAVALVALLIGGVATTLRQRAVAATHESVAVGRPHDVAPPDTTADTDTSSTVDPAPSGGAGDCSAAADPGSGPTHDVDGDGCPDLVEIDRNLVRTSHATFRVGDPGDDLRVGDWNCDGVATVLMLRPDSGEVFEFDWAARGRPTTGRLVTVVDGATSLSSGPGPDGCDAPSVERRSGPPVDPRFERPAPPDAAPAGPTTASTAPPTSTAPPIDGGTP